MDMVGAFSTERPQQSAPPFAPAADSGWKRVADASDFGVFGDTGARRLASHGTASSIGIGDDPLRSIPVTPVAWLLAGKRPFRLGCDSPSRSSHRRGRGANCGAVGA